MKRYGKTLMHHVPEGTTRLLKGLCTNYQPNTDCAEKDSLDKSPVNKVSLILGLGCTSPVNKERGYV